MTDTTPTAAPAPDRTARDAAGRLVAADWGTGPDDRTGQSGRWLIAVDGSPGSLRATEAAARLVACEARSGVDLVHVHSWLVKEAAELELARRGWHATAAARALLESENIGWRLHVRMGEAAETIVALADRLGSRGIALGSKGLTATESLFIGSVAYKVMHLAKVPVLIVR
jgi:nucleotide-binding universal stress UspA family protein